MNITLFSDLHLSENTDSEELENIANIINNYDSQLIVFLGDFFDKTNNPPKTLNMGKHFLDLISNKKKKIILLSGNHDQISSNANDQILRIFNNDNIELVNVGKYYKFDYFGLLFISYMTIQNINNYIHMINDKIPDNVQNILFMHQSIYHKDDPKLKFFGGLLYEDNYNFYKKFNKIYLGHIHEVYNYDNVSYIGSTSIKNFSSAVRIDNNKIEPKKLYIWNIEIQPNNIIENYKAIPSNIQFLNIDIDRYYQDNIYKELIDKFLIDYKCKVNIKYINSNMEQINAFISNTNIIKSVIKKENINNIISQQKINNIEFIKPQDFVLNYIQNMSNNINKENLLSEMKSIFEESSKK